jgi:lysophospholipid acyltransferase (LPLAT)-like uncharacterized protein
MARSIEQLGIGCISGSSKKEGMMGIVIAFDRSAKIHIKNHLLLTDMKRSDILEIENGWNRIVAK